MLICAVVFRYNAVYNVLCCIASCCIDGILIFDSIIISQSVVCVPGNTHGTKFGEVQGCQTILL